MSNTERSTALFAGAWAIYEDSLKRLEDAIEHWDRRELQRAAEKAWEATLQATNALILALTGVEPKSNDDRETSKRLGLLRSEDAEWNKLTKAYTCQEQALFITIVCDGDVDPIECTIHDIHATADYIRDVERLADAGKDG